MSGLNNTRFVYIFVTPLDGLIYVLCWRKVVKSQVFGRGGGKGPDHTSMIKGVMGPDHTSMIKGVMAPDHT